MKSINQIIFGFSILASNVVYALDFESIENVGFQQSTSTKLFGRDGGYSAKLGDRVLWVQGDTFTASGLKSATAQTTSLTDPLNAHDFTDATGAPRQFVPYTRAEQAYNDLNGTNNRVGLWPLNSIETSYGKGYLFYINLVITCPLCYDIKGTEIARIKLSKDANGNDKVRVNRYRKTLFPKDVISPTRIVTESDGKKYLYLHFQDTRVARVPVNAIRTRSRYQFWNGITWVSDVNLAVRTLPDGWLGTVTYNSHLGQYLATGSINFFDNRVAFRTSPTPQGPWTEPTFLDFNEMFFASSTNKCHGFYNTHVAYGDGQEIIMSCYYPTGAFRSLFQIFKVRLK